MLIQMGDAGLADLLVDPSHPERDVDRDHRCLMPFDHEDGQTVGQFVFDHPVGEARAFCRRRIKRKSQADDQPEAQRPDT